MLSYFHFKKYSEIQTYAVLASKFSYAGSSLEGKALKAKEEKRKADEELGRDNRVTYLETQLRTTQESYANRVSALEGELSGTRQTLQAMEDGSDGMRQSQSETNAGIA